MKMRGGWRKEYAQLPGLKIDPARVRSNIVIFDCEKTGKTAVELCDALREKDIWALDTEKYSVRFVTHCDVDGAGVERALAALGQIVAQPQRARA